MKKYTVKIDPDALNDIQEITNWYNDQQKGLGGRFQKTTTTGSGFDNCTQYYRRQYRTSRSRQSASAFYFSRRPQRCTGRQR